MKLRNKLILSCAALTAVAITAVSTTYAWYTQNDTVSAANVTGATAENQNSLLLISDTGNTGDWGAYTDFTDQTSAKVTNITLEPRAFVSAGSFTDLAGTSSSTGYISFDLYFATGALEAETVYVKEFSIANNKQDELPTKSVLTTDGLGSSWDATVNGTYAIDIRNALVVSTTICTIDEGTAGSTTTTHYGVEAQATSTDDDYEDGFNAHTYYNSVLGLTDDAISETDNIEQVQLSTKSASNEAWSLGDAPVVSTDATKVNALKVHFDVFLNGWDTACFDACQNQGITITMSFTSDVSKAGLGYTE